MLNDLLTLARIREGDIKAFEDVFRRYYSPLCWYAMSITGSMEAAEMFFNLNQSLKMTNVR